MTSPEKRQAARSLRRRQTEAEVAVWGMLRNRQMLGWKFRRQQVVEGFVVDFFCAEKRVVVEIDGASMKNPSRQLQMNHERRC